MIVAARWLGYIALEVATQAGGVMTAVVQERRLEARQHGAMEYSRAPTDLDAVRMYRLGRVREELKKRDYAAIILYDQLNTRYATDATDMQIWCSHNENRYVYVPAEGPVIVFEYAGLEHLSEGLPGVDEVRDAICWYYFAAGSRCQEMVTQWAREIADLVSQHGGGNKRVAIDRCGPLGVQELARHGISIRDGFEVMEVAREIKSPGEILLMRHAINVCEQGLEAMREALRPGITENALWAKLHERNIALGGEWIETRLLSSGPRTNPWFRESSMRVIEKGDMVSIDTDLVGPYGYCCDMSRSWVCGDGPASDEQRRLYAAAVAEIAHNTALLKPGMTYREVAERAWKIPDEFYENRYSSVMHAVGLCDEYPAIKHLGDFEAKGYDGIIQPGMTLCVESYIGTSGGHEGVKLEEQILITEDGHEKLTNYPLQLEFL
ncbi:MAG: aminopeptidase P family protein [Gammaproteobacteria bacterium]|nr:MAG: aminopeptidase P family protein [Gammaproteobacteria bacterium]